MVARSRIETDVESVTTIGVEDDPRDIGLTAEAVRRIWDAVVRAYRSGAHPAITLCVRRHGRVVLDRAIGYAHGGGPGDPPGASLVAATPETPFCVFSASKGITAALIHIFDERRVLRVADRVTEYIPEFAANGKDKVTIAQVLSHRAGLHRLPPEALTLEVMGDEPRLMELIYAMQPQWAPGLRQNYHALSGGYILGEVVRRATGKGIDEVLATEILDPLGFRWTRYGARPEDARVATNYPGGLSGRPWVSRLEGHALGMRADDLTRMANDPRFLGLVSPAANVVSTANELSRFYELLRCEGELDGMRVFEPATLHRALGERSRVEFDRGLLLPIRFSGGFMRGARGVSPYGRDTAQAFGHSGFVCMPAWADPERGVSVALLTSGKAIHRGFAQFLAIPMVISKEIPKVR